MSTEESLSQLITQAKEGVPQAQSRLINLYWNEVKAFVLYKINNENSAEELTVETFTKAISKLNLYDQSFNFKTWLLSIAQNNIIDYYRRKKNYNAELIGDDFDLLVTETEPSPEKLLIDQQNLKDFYQKLDKLPEKYSEILKLKYVDDLSIKDISEKLHLTESNVKVRILRGKKLLEDLYE